MDANTLFSLITDPPQPVPGVTVESRFLLAVSEFSFHLGPCREVYGGFCTRWVCEHHPETGWVASMTLLPDNQIEAALSDCLSDRLVRDLRRICIEQDLILVDLE